MRVNVYAEEMTNRVELITKTIDGNEFTAIRFYLELPCTIKSQMTDMCGDAIGPVGTKNVSGPFMHRDGDDDSAAVTFWGKGKLRGMLQKAIDLLDEDYRNKNVKIDGV